MAREKNIRKCSVVGCTRNARSKGMCSLHYRRFHYHGDVNYIGHPYRFTQEDQAKSVAATKKYYDGEYKSAEYRAWSNMLTRCYNPKVRSYPRYGGRGIEVCDRWRHSFGNFLEDMGKKPSPDMSIDRIDCDGNYCPENCRWATTKQQMRNFCGNRWLTDSDGETLCIKDMADKHGIKRSTLQMRLDVYGWSLEDALTIKVGGNHVCKS